MDDNFADVLAAGSVTYILNIQSVAWAHLVNKVGLAVRVNDLGCHVSHQSNMIITMEQPTFRTSFLA